MEIFEILAVLCIAVVPLFLCTLVDSVVCSLYVFFFVGFIYFQGFVVGFSGSKIFCLQGNVISSVDVPQASRG